MFDLRQRQIAANLQRRLPAWVVMWAPYSRRYVAIAACTREPLILSAAVPDELIDQMRDAQLAALAQTAVARDIAQIVGNAGGSGGADV